MTEPTQSEVIEFDADSLRDTARKMRSVADNLETNTTADFTDVKAKALAAANVHTVGGVQSGLVAPIYRSVEDAANTILKQVQAYVLDLRTTAQVLETYANDAESADTSSARQFDGTAAVVPVEQAVKAFSNAHKVDGVTMDTDAGQAAKEQAARAARGEIRIVSGG